MSFVRSLVFAAVAVIAAGACLPKDRSLAAAPIPTREEALPDDGPFRLIFAGPKGEEGHAREITLAFSRSVHAERGRDTGEAPAKVTRVHDGAEVAGVWQWFGGRIAVFWPAGGFVEATAYRVAVDPAIRALDGSTLAPADDFELVTRRPELLAVTYEYDEGANEHRVRLSFNHEIHRDEILRAVRVEGRGRSGTTAVTFTLAPEAWTHEETLVLDPSAAGLDDVTVIAAPTLTGQAGPVPSGTEKRLKVPDLGPLKISIACAWPDEGDSGASRCSLDKGTPALRFSKPVLGPDLAKHLVVPNRRKSAPPPDEGNVYELALGSVMNLAAGKKYEITVKAGLTAADKEKLPADRVLSLETTDDAPAVRFRDLRRETVVEAARAVVPLFVDAVNVPFVEVAAAPLDDANVADALVGRPRTFAGVAGLAGSTTKRIDLGKTRNLAQGPVQVARAHVRSNVLQHARFELPKTIRPAGTSGQFMVAARGGDAEEEVRLLSVTDLGVTSMWSPHGGLVWITKLGTGEPVADARVTLVSAVRPDDDAERSARIPSAEVYVTTTNADGVAMIPKEVSSTFLDARSEAIVRVRHGDDRAYARMPAMNPSLSDAMGTVFLERTIYRPGETAYAKGFFRAPSPSGLVPLPGRVVEVEATDDEGSVLFLTRATLDAFGAFSCEVPIPRTARLGFAALRARLDSPGSPSRARSRARARGRHAAPIAHDGWSAGAGFQIEEFRAVEFKVDAQVDRPRVVSGDAARVTVRGTYLLGAPMRDVPVEIRATRNPTRLTPPGLEGFATDAHAMTRAARGEPVALPRPGLLDAGGSVSVPIPTALANTSGPEDIEIEASIDDVSKAYAAGAQASVRVVPASIALGLRASVGSVRIGGTVRAEVAAASWDGARKAGVGARVELRRASAAGGPPVPTGQACDLTTTSTTVTCDLAVTEAGVHWLHAVARDEAGRTAASAFEFEALRDAPPPARPAIAEPRPSETPGPARTFDEECALRPPKNVVVSGADLIGLRLERSDGYGRGYSVGDAARVCVRGQGDALLTIEREGVLRYERHRVSAVGTLLSIPLSPELYPSATVAVRGVVARTAPFPAGARADRGFPRFGMGSVDLDVADPQKRLNVEIQAPSEVEPGAVVETRIRVTDARGRPAVAQLTTWAVDEGVFLLEPFRVPDPLVTFGRTRYSDVVTCDSREDLLWEHWESHHTRSPSLREGAASLYARDHVGRAAFRPTAWFRPSVVTSPDGVAIVRAKLPDNMTTWKLFAVAATPDSAFGGAESAIVSSKRLAARPQLPRFLRAGDHVEATVIVDSRSKMPLDVNVSMSATGALAGRGDTRLRLSPEAHVPVRFPLDAPAAGKGRVVFRVGAPREELADEVTVEEDITVPRSVETVLVSGSTRERAVAPIPDLSRVRDDVGGLDFRLSTTPLVGLAESLEGLVEYPYGCTEQLTSRLVPLVRLRGLARDLGVTLPRDVDASVRSSLAALLSHQRADGGFGFWPASTASEPWLTVLALEAFHATMSGGYDVPAAAVDRAFAYLEKTDRLDLGERALLEDLFASMGRPRADELRALAADATLPLFARALVARALATVDRALGRRLLSEVAGHTRENGALATFSNEASLATRRYLSSDAATTAMVLLAFVALEPESPLVPKIVRGLLSLRRRDRWPTTQASAWALLALDAARPLVAPSGAPSTARVLEGARAGSTGPRPVYRPPGPDVVARASFVGAARGEATSGTIPMARLLGAREVSFETQGAQLFYEGALRFAPRGTPSQDVDRGIFIGKSMHVLREGAPPAASSEFRLGDYVEVDLVVGTPVPRDLVVVDDPLPAGFEAVSESFANVDRRALRGRAAQYVTHRELRDDRVVSFIDALPAGVHHITYVARATSPGRFAAPPAKAECMYAPDVFGRTAAGAVTVRE